MEKIREKLNSVIQGNNEEMDFNVSEKENENDNLKSLIDKSTAYLEKNNINEARLITEIIFSHVLNVDRMLLFTLYKTEVKKEKLNKIRNYIQKIGKEKFPLQYLLNEQEFYGRKFYVNKGVLIPRQDTEVLVEEAIKILKKDKIQNPKILDIGTGSGVIGLTVALEIPDSKVIGTDISEKALEISEKNKKLLNVENIKFFKSNLFENIEYKKFDMIISNPPFYTSDYKSPEKMRNRARFEESLPFDVLLNGVDRLLSKKGVFSVIIPYTEVASFVALAALHHLFPMKLTHTYGHIDATPKRSLIAFSRVVSSCEEDSLVIERERGVYTEAYVALTKEFYYRF